VEVSVYPLVQASFTFNRREDDESLCREGALLVLLGSVIVEDFLLQVAH
jgi:hypothetical protein